MGLWKKISSWSLDGLGMTDSTPELNPIKGTVWNSDFSREVAVEWVVISLNLWDGYSTWRTREQPLPTVFAINEHIL